jgi:arylsulfatase A-like enzyme
MSEGIRGNNGSYSPLNVVIIMVDQQSASALPMYGNPVVEAPTLTGLAEEGCLFTSAFTSCPQCLPARATLFTGQYPSAHGSLDNNIYLASGRRHLLALLKEAGYRTGLTGKNHCFGPEDLRRFDVFDDCGHYGPPNATDCYRQSRQWLQNCTDLKGCWTCAVNPVGPEGQGTHWITERAIDFIRTGDDRPFFLWYSIGDPHIPFQTSEPYASMYPPESVDMPVLCGGEMVGKPRAQQIDLDVMRGELVDEQQVRRIRSIYYGMNSLVDHEVGRFLAELNQLSLSDRTLVIYLSDHGEYLGEHRMIRKSKSAYDCLIHVPMIARGPGVARGTVCEAFVGIEDVMPTVLACVGLGAPNGVQGRDLSSALAGGPGPERDFAYGEYGAHTWPHPRDAQYRTCAGPTSPDFKPGMKVGGYGKMRYIRTRRWKLVAYVDDTWELYDLANDPHELRNVYALDQNRDIREELAAKLFGQLMAVSNPGARSEGVQ